jgi:hypothetical protein
VRLHQQTKARFNRRLFRNSAAHSHSLPHQVVVNLNIGAHIQTLPMCNVLTFVCTAQIDVPHGLPGALLLPAFRKARTPIARRFLNQLHPALEPERREGNSERRTAIDDSRLETKPFDLSPNPPNHKREHHGFGFH